MVSWVSHIAKRTADTVAYFNANLNPRAAEPIQEWLSERRAILDRLADEGKSVVRTSADPAYREAQAVVDALVNQGREAINAYYGSERLPEKIQLYVHLKPDAAFS